MDSLAFAMECFQQIDLVHMGWQLEPMECHFVGRQELDRLV